MGKFLSTTYKDSVSSITNLYTEMLNNPLYAFNDKTPTIVTYYNVNYDHSSVDPGSKLQYDNVGEQTPMRWNRISNFILYGINRIELNSTIGDFGTEADPIEGECYVLPQTIIPYENDYFEIEHVKDSTWLFIVKDVQKDTLENGQNAYKLSYRLEYTDNSKILKNIIYEYEAIEKREGTNMLQIVRREDLEIAKLLDAYAVKMKKYFCELFYRERVQTFIYEDLTQIPVYDPYMVEFIIRNEILVNDEDHDIFVMHQIPTIRTFSLNYDKTMFRGFEKKDKNIIKYIHQTNISDIKAYGTTFANCYEPYYQATWKEKDFHGHETMCLGEDILYHVQDHQLFEDEHGNNAKSILWKNIIVKYFYGDELKMEEVEAIDDIIFEEAAPVFYLLPILILCVEDYIENLLNS